MRPVIGVTGGIGCGKTTATDRFAALGASIVDTDEISRAMTRAGHPALDAVAKAFGPDILLADGSLDRAKLRAQVFAAPEARQALENILHPRIRAEAAEQVALARGPYVLLVVPLLLETQAYTHLIDRILVIDCDPEVQITRVMNRSDLSRDEVERIIKTQIPRQERRLHATDILENNGDVAALYAQIDRLHALYTSLASRRTT